MSAVTLSASFVATIAFQQSPSINHHNSHLSTSRSPTAMYVLTDPTNLVKIESKQSVEDRAILEELYLLSSLAKKATRKKSSEIRKTRPTTRLASPVVGKEQKISTKKPERKIRSKSIKIPESTITRATRITTIEDGKKTETIHKGSKTEKSKRNGLHSTTPSAQTPRTIKPSKKVSFKALTTIPNARNSRKTNGPAIATLREQLAMSEDDYIRTILEKKEHLLSNQPNERSNSFSSIVEGETSLYAEVEASEETKIPYRSQSTMRGFLEKASDRSRAYSDGIKIAERNPGMEFVGKAKSKKNQARTNGQIMYKASKSVPDSLVQFANEIHSVRRITPEEEINLGELTQEALRVQNIYVRLEAELEREPTDDEWCAASGKFNMEALSQIIEEGVAAKDKLVTSNLRMVQRVVNIYIKNGLKGNYNSGDMMQEGIIALIRAAEKFDPSKGFRFSTYAMYWIRAAIRREQDLQSRIVRVPQRLHELHRKICNNRKDLIAKLNRLPTKKELCDAVGISLGQLERCETAFSYDVLSLDQKMDNKHRNFQKEQSRTEFYDVISSRPGAEFDEETIMELREDLLRAMDLHLTEEDATIIKLRFGMDDKCATTKKNCGRTFAEVGEMVGLPRDTVRKRVPKVLKRFEELVGDDLQFYIGDICI